MKYQITFTGDSFTTRALYLLVESPSYTNAIVDATLQLSKSACITHVVPRPHLSSCCYVAIAGAFEGVKGHVFDDGKSDKVLLYPCGVSSVKHLTISRDFLRKVCNGVMVCV